jgi:dTDP-4-dehydrorhamnose reductase
MRVVIFGAGGMLGHDLVQQAPKDVEVRAFTHADVDVTNSEALLKVLSNVQPAVLMNAAAYTQVDRAETDQELAFSVNGTAVGNLGRLAAARGIRVVHVSTDYVFDGSTNTPYSEHSEPNPINVYGASKLAGEQALRESGAACLIVRSQWLFGLTGKSFPRTMWERAHAGTATRVVDDQFGRPTYTKDLARSLWRLTISETVGLRHVANRSEASWFDVAKHVFQRANKTNLLSACASKDYPTAARRPRYSVLDLNAFEEENGGLRSWRDALDEFLTLLR